MNIRRPAAVVLIPSLLLISMSCASLSPRDQMHFGIEAAQNQLWDEAIFRWTKILQTNPSSPSALNNLAVAYEKKGMAPEAEKAYLQALKLDPKNQRIQSNYIKFKKNRDRNEEPPKESEKKREGVRR